MNKIDKKMLESYPYLETLKNIFNNFPEAVLILNKTGKILYINKRSVIWLKRKVSEVVGKNFIQIPFIPNKSKALLLKNFAKRLKGEKVSPYEVEFDLGQGEGKRIGLIQVNTIEEDDKKYIITMVTDVSKSKRLEEAVQEKEIEEKADTLKSEYIKERLSSISSVLLKITMGDFSERIDIPEEEDEFTEYFVALNLMINDFSDLLKENQNKTEELQKIKENLEKIVEVRTATLEQQAQDLKKFQLAVDGASDHIVITDPDGIILYTNQAVENVTGYNPKELVGKKAGIADNWGGQEKKRFYENLWRTIKEEKKTFVGEINNKKKNGQGFIAEIRISPILNENEEVIFLVAIERDITRLKEIDRMKTEFISLASHQLRTPLSAMKWFLEMLLEGDAGKINEEQQEFITNINDSNERMIQLVNSLLNISRIESGRIIIDPQPTDLRKLVENEVLKEIQKKLEDKKQVVVFSAHQNLPKIKIDPKLIRHVYMNLLTNAIKYTDKGGEISIFISKKGNEVISQITDTGYGIPQDEQYRVFEKFFRGQNVIRRETDGSGLGLYLIKAIVESSGGKIWFESKEDKGTTFWFSLPIKGSEAKEGEVSIDTQY